MDNLAMETKSYFVQINIIMKTGNRSSKYEKISMIAAGGYHSAVLTNKGKVFAWGDNMWPNWI